MKFKNIKEKTTKALRKLGFVAIATALCFFFIKNTIEKNYVPTTIIHVPNHSDALLREDLIGDLIEKTELEAEALKEPTVAGEIAMLIDDGVSFDVVPQGYSDVYELYEEELPETIEVEKKAPVKKITEPMLAIVIDDMGISPQRTRDINSLHVPITSSYLTYAGGLNKQIAASRAAGHEIIIHTPMQPKGNIDLAPDMLTTEMSKEEIQANLSKMLDKFSGVGGINNHMGSRFTEDKERMEWVMEVLKERNMFFLDSKTSGKSKGKLTAKQYGIKYVSRNVFLDNKNDYEYILGQINQASKIAEKNGLAIAIGHPKSQTYLALKDWLEQNKKIKIVHLSEIVEKLNP